MERNKLRRLFLNYFLISWHLFAFMIIFLLGDSFPFYFSSPACLLITSKKRRKGKKEKSIARKTNNWGKRSGSEVERVKDNGWAGLGWRMMNQFTNNSSRNSRSVEIFFCTIFHTKSVHLVNEWTRKFIMLLNI